MFWGIILIIIGSILLLSRIGIIAMAGSIWDYFWPILILAVGIKIILGHDKKNDKPKGTNLPPAGQ